LSGTIATLESDDDLREALQHFRSLLSIGVLDEADLERETLEVVSELARWGWEASGEAVIAAAPWN
jgi:predicted Zn-dependent peptidase